MPRSTILSVSTRALLDACQALGVDLEQLLAGQSLTRTQIYDPDGRLDGSAVSELWRRAYELSGDPQLALHAAEALPFGAYKVIDFLADSSNSVGAALESVCNYYPLINDGVDLRIEQGSEIVHIEVRARTGYPAISSTYIEYSFAALFLRTRAALGVDFPCEGIDFECPAPNDLSEHQRIFGCPLRFDQPSSRMSLSLSTWTQDVQRKHTGLVDVLREHADRLLAERPESAPERRPIEAAIREELRGGDPTLETIAKRMGMSSRTLQRKLADEGLKFAELLEEMRSVMARSYLEQADVSVAEVGYLLGYADQSTFSRAFKRWTGLSPAQFRKRAR